MRDQALATGRALGLVLDERARQIEVEGYTPDHDDRYRQAELSRAAACYATPRGYRRYEHGSPANPPVGWPWARSWWKPESHEKSQTIDGRLRELAKAGALILAEIERLQRREDEVTGRR